MVEILDFTKSTQQIDIEKKYDVGSDPIKKIIRFLSYNDKRFLPELRFKVINIFNETFTSVSFEEFLESIYDNILENFNQNAVFFNLFNEFEDIISEEKILYLKKLVIFSSKVIYKLVESKNNPKTLIEISSEFNCRLEPLIKIKKFLDVKLGLTKPILVGKHNRLQKRVEIDNKILKHVLDNLSEMFDISYNLIGEIIGTELYNNLGGDTMPYECFKLLKSIYGKDIPHQIHGRVLTNRKWAFLYYDKYGNLLTDDEALEAAAKYLVKKILKGETRIYTVKHIMKVLKRDDYIMASRHRGLNYNDILLKAGLELNIDKKKWYSYFYDIKGNRLTYDESLKKFADYLSYLISENNWKLKEKQAPTYEFLQEKTSGFLNAFSSIGITYNQVIKKAGLDINHPMNFWTFLNKDKSGKKLTKKEAIEVAAKFLKNEILTEKFLEINGFKKKEPPSYTMLEDTHIGFISAITSRKLSYPKILREAGFSILGIDLMKEIGNDSHKILEALFIIISRQNNCLSFYETYPSIMTYDKKLYKRFGRNHCDNSIIVDENFRNLSEWAQNIPDHIEIINIDYFLGNSKKIIAEKCLRAYQAKNKMMVLVPLHATKYNLHQTPYYIPHRKNVIIMNPYSFAKNFGFNGKALQGFTDTIKLIKRATYREKSRKMLSDRVEDADKFLDKNPEHSQRGLENYLDSDEVLRMDLLEYTSEK